MADAGIRFTDTEKYFVSEASVYRLLKSLDLITSPAFIVIKAADEFRDKTMAINQLWQTDFTYHECINNLTSADVYFGRGQAILKQRERIKRKTMETRRLPYRKYAA